VFVPAPEAYVLAATMFGMSVIGWIALLRARNLGLVGCAVGVVLQAVAALALTALLRPA
jgi:hypothetical protein